MDGSVTEALSHDESGGGRNVTGVHGSIMGNNKSVTGVHGNATSRHRSVMGAWLHTLQKCTLKHGNYKGNGQPIHEQVTASDYYLHKSVFIFYSGIFIRMYTLT